MVSGLQKHSDCRHGQQSAAGLRKALPLSTPATLPTTVRTPLLAWNCLAFSYESLVLEERLTSNHLLLWMSHHGSGSSSPYLLRLLLLLIADLGRAMENPSAVCPIVFSNLEKSDSLLAILCGRGRMSPVASTSGSSLPPLGPRVWVAGAAEPLALGLLGRTEGGGGAGDSVRVVIGFP